MIDFLIKNDSFIMSILTMIMGIYAGFIPLYKSHGLRIGITLCVVVIFNAYVWLICCHKYKSGEEHFIWCGVVVAIISVAFIILCIFKFKPKDIVGRRKLGKKIMDLTKAADVNSPICIFGGDLDFFGNVKKQEQTNIKWSSKIKHFFASDYNSNIETNKQMQQIINKDFKKVQILCSKPSFDDPEDTNMTKMILRYGYIAKKLGKKVTFKFVQDDDSALDLNIYNCINCTYKNKCKKPGSKKCLQLEDLSKKFAYNPDTKLRGRIIVRPDTKAKDIILTTTIKCKEKYMIREYGLSNKKYKDKLDWQLYDIIWNVWWERCSEDKNLIKQCVDEYTNEMEKQKE